mgnify:CR=1 FL=1
MSKFISDINKLVNTIQKADKLLTEKPKRKRITKEEEFQIKMRGIVEFLLQQPAEIRNSYKTELIDNLNEM